MNRPNHFFSTIVEFTVVNSLKSDDIKCLHLFSNVEGVNISHKENAIISVRNGNFITFLNQTTIIIIIIMPHIL